MKSQRFTSIEWVVVLVLAMVFAAGVVELATGCGDDAPAPPDALPTCAKLGCDGTALCNSDGSACYCAGVRCEL